MSIWTYANPQKFMGFTGKILPFLVVLTAVTMVVGLGWGFFLTPEDARQGATVKIIFIHVPAALMAINAWLMMLVASLIWLIRRHPVSALCAKAAAPVGAILTLVALLTGAIWGKPMWGTYWVWDPRLTSFLILFLFYLGYMALWSALEDRETASDLTSITCLVGSVFAILSRYAVKFWDQGLHQGTSVPVATGGRTISDVFFYPLILSMLGFALLFVSLVLIRARTAIRAERLAAILRREGGQNA
ncbi:heme exporter protein CcmC [Rhodobacterales bacterium HTCC2150]|nr:heme exporter protein CcmC [Rhodobacterales bacterium HTCC2150] [Rhodobacteraceae bacterium HTCC2150]